MLPNDCSMKVFISTLCNNLYIRNLVVIITDLTVFSEFIFFVTRLFRMFSRMHLNNNLFFAILVNVYCFNVSLN